MKFSMVDYSIVWVYLIAMLLIGVYYAGHIKNLGDYILGGRRLAWPLAMASVIATGCGAGFTTGYVSLAYENGFVVGLAAYIVSAAGIAVGAVLASRLRKTNAFTLSDIVDTYYGRLGRFVSGFAGAFSELAWVGIQYMTVGIMLEAFLGVPRIYGSILALVIVITYTTLGGLWSVTTTDILQWSIFTIGIFALMTSIGIAKAGGAVGFSQIPAVYFSPTGKMTTTAMITLCMAYFLGLMLVPSITQRFFACRSPKHASITGWGYVLFVIFVLGTTMVVCAIIGHVIVPGIDSDSVFSMLMVKLLPSGVLGIAISAVLAAIMSTADSGINTAVAYFMRDIYQSFINPLATDRQNLMWSRVLSIVCGALPFLFVLAAPKIWSLVAYVYLFWAPGIFVPILVAMLWGKASPQSGTCGMIAGITFALVWLFGLGEPYGIHSVAAGTFVCGVVMLIVHPLTKNTTPGKWCTPINPIDKIDYVKSEIRTIHPINTSEL